jgi:hypothetical protein
MRCGVVVASPARTSSTICSTVKAMRDHERLGRPVAGGGKQLDERAAAVGLEVVRTAAGLGHGVVAAVLGRCP